LNLLSGAEQDAEEQASKARRLFRIAPVPVPAIEFGPMTKLEAYRNQQKKEQAALWAAIDEQIQKNLVAKQRQEAHLAMLLQMAQEYADAINDRDPDISGWVLRSDPGNGWQNAMNVRAGIRCGEAEEAARTLLRSIATANILYFPLNVVRLFCLRYLPDLFA